ncbi:MAG: hypothetical protein IJF17_02235 [Thermoguttaceae bacterium]|nr:hypothetical protein [Thermoguttaceae bacterium]
MKDHAWRLGPMRVVPYGRLWASMLVTSSKTSSSTLLGTPLTGEENGDPAFNIQARTSRLGVNIGGPDLEYFGGARSSGVVEFDFNNSANSENKGALLFRQAFGQLESEDFKFVFGQTKDLASPLNSTLIDDNALYGFGNLGYRHPAANLTRYFYPNQNVRAETAMGLSMICGSDFTSFDAPGILPDHSGPTRMEHCPPLSQ